MPLQSEADAVLRNAVSNGDVPGVVAAATDRGATIYEGGFGERMLGSDVAMTPDTVGWIASMNPDTEFSRLDEVDGFLVVLTFGQRQGYQGCLRK